MTAPAGAGGSITSTTYVPATGTTPPAAAAAQPAATTPPAPAGSGSDYTAPASQAELDRIVQDRLSRQRAQYGGMTPEQFAEMKAKADAADAEKATDVQRATAEAQKSASEAADAKYLPMLAETAFRVAIGEAKPATEVDEFVADLNLSRFITADGKVDTAKVLARVKEYAPAAAPAKSGGTSPKGPVVPGHNPGGTTPGAVGVKAGADLYDQRHPKKT